MDGFAVRQKDNPKIAIFHLRDLCPASKPSVGLLHLAYRGFGSPLHPLVRDHRAVGARSHGVEIGSGLHAENLTDCERPEQCRLDSMTFAGEGADPRADRDAG